MAASNDCASRCDYIIAAGMALVKEKARRLSLQMAETKGLTKTSSLDLEGDEMTLFAESVSHVSADMTPKKKWYQRHQNRPRSSIAIALGKPFFHLKRRKPNTAVIAGSGKAMARLTTSNYTTFAMIFDRTVAAWMKFCYAIVMAVLFIIVLIQVKIMIQDFLNHPTVTRISVIEPDHGLDIPPVTVCTLLKINNSAVMEKYPKIDKATVEFASSSFFSAYGTSLMDLEYFQRRGFSNVTLQAQLDAALGNIGLSTFFDETSFQCEDQFLVCWMRNAAVKHCCEHSLMQVKKFLIHSGSCFEVQLGKNSKQLMPGLVGGLGFAYWYPNEHILKSAYNAYDQHGVHLYLDAADAMLEKNPVVLPVGYHAYISLRATRVTRLLNNELGRRTCENPTLKYFPHYSSSNCQVECLLDAIIHHCNCTGVNTYNNLPQQQLCNPMEALNCYASLAYDFSALLVKCRQTKCPEACDYWTYKASLTVGKVFNPIVEDEMLEYWRLPKGNPNQSLIIADVYLDQIEYNHVEQRSALTIENFVASIGGALGLWTGASIITWVHIMFYCFHLVFQKQRKKSMASAMETPKRHRSL